LFFIDPRIFREHFLFLAMCAAVENHWERAAARYELLRATEENEKYCGDEYAYEYDSVEHGHEEEVTHRRAIAEQAAGNMAHPAIARFHEGRWYEAFEYLSRNDAVADATDADAKEHVALTLRVLRDAHADGALEKTIAGARLLLACQRRIFGADWMDQSRRDITLLTLSPALLLDCANADLCQTTRVCLSPMDAETLAWVRAMVGDMCQIARVCLSAMDAETLALVQAAMTRDVYYVDWLILACVAMGRHDIIMEIVAERRSRQRDGDGDDMRGRIRVFTHYVTSACALGAFDMVQEELSTLALPGYPFNEFDAMLRMRDFTHVLAGEMHVGVNCSACEYAATLSCMGRHEDALEGIDVPIAKYAWNAAHCTRSHSTLAIVYHRAGCPEQALESVRRAERELEHGVDLLFARALVEECHASACAALDADPFSPWAGETRAAFDVLPESTAVLLVELAEMIGVEHVPLGVACIAASFACSVPCEPAPYVLYGR
jgi:hypothetical protein